MKRIAFVFDDISQECGEKVFSNLEQREDINYTKGIIPVYAHEDEFLIVSSLYSIIVDSDFVIGISSSGSGIAIYANKINGYIAASVTSFSEIDEAIRDYSANVFDVSMHNPNVVLICKRIIERMRK